MRTKPHLQSRLVQAASTVLGRVLDEMPEHIAILDARGDIIWTNRAWKRFSVENGGHFQKTDVGANYLSVCDQAERQHILEAGVLRSEIEQMLRDPHAEAAGQSDSKRLEYPCHSPIEKRWFVVGLHRYEFEGSVYVAVIHQNVSVRRILNDRVAELNQKLSARERAAALSEWAGFVSHEIKNPLSVISTRAGLIRLGLRSKTPDVEFLLDSCSEIEDTVEQIIEIVEGMLSMFKTPSHGTFEKFSMQELFEEAVAMTRDFVGSIQVEIPSERSLSELVIESDRIHLLQIITNLIRNAAQALRKSKNPWIRLEAHSDEEVIQIRVLDSGPGVPEEARSFFKKGGRSEIFRGPKAGAGVGFKISRTLAEIHGGELYLEESTPHTCFVLSLPQQASRARAA